MSVQVFRGFTNPVDPTPAELRAWAYHPDTIPLSSTATTTLDEPSVMSQAAGMLIFGKSH